MTTSDYTTWKDIPDYEGLYQASTDGSIRRIYHKKKANKPVITYGSLKSIGYMYTILTKGDKKKSISVHRLIALTFLGKCPDGLQVNHKNGIKHDNRLENLEYTTASENIRHSFDVLGKQVAKGEGHYAAKLTEEKVLEIRALSVSGVKHSDIAIRYNISRSQVAMIVNRRIWKHI